MTFVAKTLQMHGNKSSPIYAVTPQSAAILNKNIGKPMTKTTAVDNYVEKLGITGNKSG